MTRFVRCRAGQFGDRWLVHYEDCIYARGSDYPAFEAASLAAAVEFGAAQSQAERWRSPSWLGPSPVRACGHCRRRRRERAA